MFWGRRRFTMSRTVLVQFRRGQDEDRALVSRLRDFGEIVFRKLPSEKGWGEIDLTEVDKATQDFSITNVKASKLRQLQDWVFSEAELQQLQIVLEVR